MKITDMKPEQFENTHFIDPITKNAPVSLVGFVGKYNTPSHPVFNIESTESISDIVSTLKSLCESCKLDSGGLQAYFLKPTVNLKSKSFSLKNDVVVVLKIENWWTSCIPNDTTNIQSYISQQEDKMLSTLKELSITKVCHNKHKDCMLSGGSQIKEGYGQYQFIGRLD